MSDYRRLISYIYEYEGKTKGKNVGFVKLESRKGQCRLNVNVKKIYVGGNAIGVYLLGKGGQETFLGNMFVRGGNGEFRASVDAGNVEGSGFGLDTYYGLTVHDVKNAWRCYTTIWEDAVMPAMELLPAAPRELTAGAVSSVVREIEKEIAREEAREAAETEIREVTETEIREADEMEIRRGDEMETGEVRAAAVGIEAAQPSEMPSEPETPQAPAPPPEMPSEPEVPQAPAQPPEMPSGPETPQAPAPPLEAPQPPELPLKPESPQVPAQPPEPETSPNPSQSPETGSSEPLSRALASPELENPEVLKYLQETEAAETSPEALWEELKRSYPKICPFDYEDGCEVLTVRPQDIGRLPRENWGYGNNSFLLHGYYNFRYLILVRLGGKRKKPRYLIGVPGHYYSNEKYMASMFGFPNFVLSKKQPVNDGRFGYWYTDIRVR